MFANRIWHCDTLGNIHCWVTIWGMSRLFVAKPYVLLALDDSSGAPENLEYISIWPIDDCIFPNPSCNQVSLGDMEYMCQNMRPGLTYLWHSHFFCWPMIVIPVLQWILGIVLWHIQHSIYAHPIWQYSQSRQYWVLLSKNQTCAHLFGAKLQLWRVYCWSLGTLRHPHPRVWDNETWLGYSWLSCNFRSPVFAGLWLKVWHNCDLESILEWGSWMYMKPNLTRCNSLWMYHSVPGTAREQQIHNRSTSIPVCGSLRMLVGFKLIMFFLTLNQLMLCMQSVIYQDTSCFGAGGSSHSACTNRWMYAWSGYEGRR